MSTGDTGLTQDVLFDILSSARRRYVLHVLNTKGEMELTELAEHVAARENDIEVEELTKQQRKRVYVSLYQTHVPKLRDAGLVAYDEDGQVVSLRSNANDLARYLDDEQERFPWQYVYLGIALVGLVVVGLSAAAVPPFDVVSQTLIAFVLVIGLLLTAVAHAAAWVSDRGDPFPDGPE